MCLPPLFVVVVDVVGVVVVVALQSTLIAFVSSKWIVAQPNTNTHKSIRIESNRWIQYMMFPITRQQSNPLQLNCFFISEFIHAFCCVSLLSPIGFIVVHSFAFQALLLLLSMGPLNDYINLGPLIASPMGSFGRSISLFWLVCSGTKF